MITEDPETETADEEPITLETLAARSKKIVLI